MFLFLFPFPFRLVAGFPGLNDAISSMTGQGDDRLALGASPAYKERAGRGAEIKRPFEKRTRLSAITCHDANIAWTRCDCH
ncbi:hypothetical protein M431DRAFT_489132 [Trichoderma harzianum CBS 226.95]|uniref:Secreted protein n=1 Tax=Trichoderma harzianum CBS 226.95 TaxID=983964 RepID=A0A2T4ATR4_TRIHA|nr:hypothetical protein M431DRAFT_489132 [Trichoderma harzianum CBS 226.95]PTB60368.1 hypothetical protein M431DRAFT_489132 [Trichoderma harzianum CBS 226.95]